jgi:hypothetical protein
VFPALRKQEKYDFHETRIEGFVSGRNLRLVPVRRTHTLLWCESLDITNHLLVECSTG